MPAITLPAPNALMPLKPPVMRPVLEIPPETVLLVLTEIPVWVTFIVPELVTVAPVTPVPTYPLSPVMVPAFVLAPVTKGTGPVTASAGATGKVRTEIAIRAVEPIRVAFSVLDPDTYILLLLKTGDYTPVEDELTPLHVQYRRTNPSQATTDKNHY
jgi:hypothetical protein